MTMRKFILALALIFQLPAGAQVKMADMLKSMPDTLCAYLTDNNMLDCIDFKDAGMKAEVRNVLDGRSELLTLTEQFASVQLSKALRADMRLLDADGRQLLCMVSTYGAGMQESVVRFFTTEWVELPSADYVTVPDEMFTATLGEQQSTLDIQPVSTLHQPAMEEQEIIAKPQINLKWDGAKFK